ncbi:RicAFT regulatory complex protein RicA family protein [Pontibacillus salicampi]|uniref:RicAFT regulatory complex protein RicA family protein n=1 Tax=Pontibacillus salicampi TaxID=1449801 RepID=A0ABV6LS00_9BACI
MANYTKEQVVARAHELAKTMADTPEIDRFKQVEAKINENKKVQEYISRIKSLQKQAVNFQYYEKTEALKKVEKEINRLQDELDSIPVVQEFKDTQTDVNDFLQMVTNTIANEVTNEIIRETGGDLLNGTTGSALQAGSDSSCDH